MARFYLSGDNSRGNEVTAMGNGKGQSAHLRGWSAGVEVHAHPANDNKEVDVFDIYASAGSGSGTRQFLGSVVETPDGPRFVPNEVKV